MDVEAGGEVLLDGVLAPNRFSRLSLLSAPFIGVDGVVLVGVVGPKLKMSSRFPPNRSSAPSFFVAVDSTAGEVSLWAECDWSLEGVSDEEANREGSVAALSVATATA